MAKKIPQEVIDKIIQERESQIDDQMGHLHNRFVGFISESKIPIDKAILVLELLLKEALDQAEKKYIKE